MTLKPPSAYLSRLLCTICLFALFSGSLMAQAPVITSFSPVAGGQWDPVTIKGKYFNNATAVKFGGVDAAFFYVQDSATIYAYIGPGNTGSVTVITPLGNVAKGGFKYTAPYIKSFSPTSAYHGNAVVIKGYNFTKVKKVLFGAVPADSFKIVSDTVINAKVPDMVTDNYISISDSLKSFYKTGFKYTGPGIVSFSPSNAVSGATVVIKGTYLTGATDVSFGGKPAKSFTVNSSTQITATVGTAAAGNVSVTSPYGNATHDGFIKPFIKGFTPNYVYYKDTVLIHGLNFTGGTAVTFTGLPALKFTVLADTLIRAILPHCKSGNVSITTPSGSANIDGLVIEYPIPVVASISPLSVDSGATITFKGKYLTDVIQAQLSGIPLKSLKILSDTVATALVGNARAGYVYLATPDRTSYVPTYINYTGPYIAGITINKGGPGTHVIIVGDNLSGAAAVKFGASYAASFTTSFPGNIDAVVGQGKSGLVTVTFPDRKLTFNGFTFIPTPVITSLAPLKGPLGTTVTIQGTGFDSTAANNIVWFGAAKAPVITATATELTVKVPAGATTNGPVSVTANNLTGVSKNNFYVTFSGAGTDISPTDFAPQKNFSTSASDYLNGPILRDMDGDGKPDVFLPISYRVTNTVFGIARNTSTPGKISTAPTAFFKGEWFAADADVCDFDGDGKPDILNSIINSTTNFFDVFRNTSTPGKFSFDEKIVAALQYLSYKIADFDNDGKPDIIVKTIYSVAVLRNKSTPGNVAFETPVVFDIPLHSNDGTFAIGDMDGDGKIDVLGNYGGGMSIMRNTSTPSKISFATGQILDKNNQLQGQNITVADIDGDGKPEVIRSNQSNNINVYLNTGTPGHFSFATPVKFYAGVNNYSNDFTDLDGDGLPDLMYKDDSLRYTRRVLKNISTPGHIAFRPRMALNLSPDYYIHNSAFATGDIDMDGKPDILGITPVTGNYNSFCVYRNLVGTPHLMASGVDSAAATSAKSLPQNIFSIRPNPARDYVTVRLGGSDKPAMIYLTDMLGKTVKIARAEKGVTEVSISLSGLAKGMYKIIYTNGLINKSETLLVQ